MKRFLACYLEQIELVTMEDKIFTVLINIRREIIFPIVERGWIL